MGLSARWAFSAAGKEADAIGGNFQHRDGKQSIGVAECGIGMHRE